jgi:DNA polymerase III alpha subunit
MIYQEDVIRVAHGIAGMSLGEADLLRRAMSGKLRSRDAMRRLRGRFLDGARARGVDAETAEEIWRQIESFAGYAFCKAHSASYALLSFRLAWLKAHHPAEFLAAVVTNRGGFYHHTAYIEEARRMGIRILPPDVNRSRVAFTGRGREIRTGLMQVRGISASTLRAVETARAEGGEFTSLQDFRDRTGADPSETERLIRAGAFASLGMTRPELLWRLHLMDRARGSGRKAGPPTGAPPLFPEPPGEDTSPRIPRFPDYPPERRLALEAETIGYNTGRHPLEALRHLYRERRLIEASTLGRMAGKRVRLLGRLIAAKKIDTRKGEFMQFLSLEDTTDTFEVVLFPAAYQRYGALLRDRGPYIVTGKVLVESGCVSIDAERLERVEVTAGGRVATPPRPSSRNPSSRGRSPRRPRRNRRPRRSPPSNPPRSGRGCPGRGG